MVSPNPDEWTGQNQSRMKPGLFQPPSRNVALRKRAERGLRAISTAIFLVIVAATTFFAEWAATKILGLTPFHIPWILYLTVVAATYYIAWGQGRYED